MTSNATEKTAAREKTEVQMRSKHRCEWRAGGRVGKAANNRAVTRAERKRAKEMGSSGGERKKRVTLLKKKRDIP